jgi:hypothetical protein
MRSRALHMAGWLTVMLLALGGPPTALAGVCTAGKNLPSPWVDQDFGAPGGCADYESSTGTYTVRGVGNVIFGTTDSFHFASRTFTGNFQMVAHLADLGGGAQNAAAGLMVRETLTATSRHAFLGYQDQGGPGGIKADGSLWRSIAAEPTYQAGYIAVPALNATSNYQKVVRWGDQITLYYSPDATNWMLVEGVTLPGLASTVNVGMAVRSADGVNPIAATFDTVSVATLTLPYTTSWIGNTFGGSVHVPQDVAATFVTPAGKTYTNTVWDEGAAEMSVYDTNGTFERQMADTHSYGRSGGHAITVTSSYVYAGMEQQYFDATGKCAPNNQVSGCLPCQYKVDGDPTCYSCPAPPSGYPFCGTNYFTVRRYNLDGSPAPWPGGVGKGPDGSQLVIPTAATPAQDHVRGLAFGNGNELYISDAYNQKVQVYDATTGASIRNFAVTRPRGIAVDASGNLWIIQAKNGDTPGTGKVLKYFPTGQKRPTEITAVDVPTAVTVASDGKIWVADDGQAYQQIRIFNANGNLSSTFGTAIGVYATTGGLKGAAQATRFNGPVGIGLDSSSNIYVASDGVEIKTGQRGTAGSGELGTGTELKKFSPLPTANLLWQRLGLEWVDTTDADPASDGVDLYTRQTHYTMNYANPPGQEWTYKGLTLDRYSYPDDGRLHEYDAGGWGAAIVRRIGGQRILFLTTQYGGYLGIFRFDPNSEIAIPSGLMMKMHPPGSPPWPPNFPATGRWIWRDAPDGNGNCDARMDAGEYEADGPEQREIWNWSVDDNGDIWTASQTLGPGIRRYRFKGLDTCGNPIYHGTNEGACTDGNCVEEFATTPEFGAPNAYCSVAGDPCTGVMRAYYLPASDTMYLSGFTPAHPKDPAENTYSTLGREIIRYDNWHGSRTIKWRITDLPYCDDPNKPCIASLWQDVARSLDVTCARVFVGIDGVPPSLIPEVRVYDAKTGSRLLTRVPGPEVAGKSGQNISPAGVNAIQRANGEYRIFAEELIGGKVLMYQVAAPTCGFCAEHYCTGVGIGCTSTGCNACGCCAYQCNVSLPDCQGWEQPPPPCP